MRNDPQPWGRRALLEVGGRLGLGGEGEGGGAGDWHFHSAGPDLHARAAVSRNQPAQSRFTSIGAKKKSHKDRIKRRRFELGASKSRWVGGHWDRHLTS